MNRTARAGQRLSRREQEFIGAICAGERCSEIAVRWMISPKTAENHAANVRRKLGARTLAHAVYEYVTRYRSAP
jgi:DNA-binding CsgD family transcriptional regulator